MEYDEKLAAITSNAEQLVPPTHDDIGNLRCQMASFLANWHNPKRGRKWLAWQVLDDSSILATLMALLGVSKTSLQSFIAALQNGSYPEVAEYLKFDKWKRNKNLNFHDSERASALFNLLLDGYEKFKISCDFINSCKKEKLSVFTDSLTLETIAAYALKGSRASKKGNKLQAVYHKMLNKLGVATKQGKIKGTKNSKTWDLIIPTSDRDIIVEVSSVNTTASGMTAKKDSMLRAMESLGNEFEYVFNGGGIGWQQRLNDCRQIAEKFDFCFSTTREGAKQFATYVCNKLNISKTNEEIGAALDYALTPPPVCEEMQSEFKFLEDYE